MLDCCMIGWLIGVYLFAGILFALNVAIAVRERRAREAEAARCWSGAGGPSGFRLTQNSD